MENKKWYHKFGFGTPETQNNPEVYSFNTISPFQDTKYNYSKPYVSTSTNQIYVPFGQDNLYPYVLLDMFATSPFHAAIVEWKTKAILGNGITIKVQNESTLERKIKEGLIENMFDFQFLTRFIQEYLIHGRNCIKIIGTNKKVVEIIPAEKIRNANNYYKKYDNEYWFNEDWRLRRGDMTPFPAYSKFDTKTKEQIKVYQILTPGVEVYSIPSYSSAGNWIWLDGQISLFQKQNIENSINPSAIFKFYENPGSKEEKEKFIQDLQSSFSSARNAGKILTFFSNGKELAPDVEIADANKLDKSFAAVQENIIRNVSYSHSVNPMLMGIQTAGSLGNTEELNTAFKMFDNMYLKSTQGVIESYLNDILKITGFEDAKVEFERKDNFLD